ncbi:PEP-CTERM sorting domain-containing protein [Microcystis sp. LEGE 08355]|uniref:PEP-CTERM sorting domain-containing protein n=1 Tax=Microcystis sp. LEGE 08355 TaxID=1828687 RepID=UPI0018811775|nr:PEP-CTERM sorting domain-containing protein [Microcystis sp. LEGE 08355]MBE9075692.1 PEP-CTERM sorting domain-containing protein [Microcystis sp. LEGE 08355]
MPLKSSFCYSVALATVATATLAPVASAATFNFSYTSSLGTITATVDGTLQPDNNTVFVSSISNTTFNGSPAPALPLTGSYVDSILAGGVVTGQAVLSLDGSGLDFVACNTTNCNDGFGFLPAGLIGPVDLFASVGGYGSLPGGEPFVLANYSLTPVPEPATVLGLLSVAGVGLLCKGRKLEK